MWAFCITDKAASDDVKAAFENSATRAFGPAGFLEQDDSENWCEIQKLLKGHRARNSKLCLEMGLGQEKRREDGIPGSPTTSFRKPPRAVCTNVGPIYSAAKAGRKYTRKPPLTSRR